MKKLLTSFCLLVCFIFAGASTGTPVFAATQTKSDGTYCIQAKHSGKVLDIIASSTDNLVSAIQYDYTGSSNQKFNLIPIDNEFGYYYIQNKNSGKYLTVIGSSMTNLTPIVQYDLLKGTSQENSQKFKIISVPGDTEYYYIQVKYSGKYLTVLDGSKDNNVPIVQYDFLGKDNQMFKFTSN